MWGLTKINKTRVFQGYARSKWKTCTFLEEPRVWQTLSNDNTGPQARSRLVKISILVLPLVLTSCLAVAVSLSQSVSSPVKWGYSYLVCVWHSRLSQCSHTVMLLPHCPLLGLQSPLFWIKSPPGPWSYSQDGRRIPGVWDGSLQDIGKLSHSLPFFILNSCI